MPSTSAGMPLAASAAGPARTAAHIQERFDCVGQRGGRVVLVVI
jgi:hypothetical protein